MKKELPGGVVAGIIAVAVVVVGVLLWKAVAPPGPAGIKPMDAATMKVVQQKHAQSVQDITKQQMQLYNQIHGGGH